MKNKTPNHLIHETSPYLLQHAYNPVEWYPWSELSLSKARELDRPILLSIGYSACHWCHVMEHESFENEAIAKLMNENFINIKVDREERPDLDHIYQNVAQLMTHSGGWPLTVFLTPDLRPFFGGTYFPPTDRYGRAGFSRVLMSLSHAYKNQKNDIEDNAQKLTESIQQIEALNIEQHTRPSQENLTRVADTILSRMDKTYGGLQGAPKFPHTMTLAYLWRIYLSTGKQEYRESVIYSLKKMAEGGIYDQLGGGFHRYSVDQEWLVPHFEKMLYDNALLIQLYSEVLLTEQSNFNERELFINTVQQTLEYLFREMLSQDGVFYSSQDADSLDEYGVSEEGEYFVWTTTELEKTLSAEDYAVFKEIYEISPEGNFENGRIILRISKSVSDTALKLNLSEREVQQSLERAKSRCLQQRKSRARPHRDDKILASWNGLMISALTYASLALQKTHPDLSKKTKSVAEQAFQFIVTHFADSKSSRLHAVYKDGVLKCNAYLDDYAFLSQAAINLTRLSNNKELNEIYLEIAKQWTNYSIEHFSDENNIGFYFTSDNHEKLIHRTKNFYDQAIPSGIAVTIENMIFLAEYSADSRLYALADEQLYKTFELFLSAPLGMSELGCAGLLYELGAVIVKTDQPVFENIFNSSVLSMLGKTHETKNTLICHKMTCNEHRSNEPLSEKIKPLTQFA